MTAMDLTGTSAGVGGSLPLNGYLATPSGDGPWPGLVLVHEIFGLDDQMRAHADRLAAAGFLTLAVDLFSAGGARRCLVSTFLAMRRGTGRAYVDIRVARDWLLRSEHCTGRVGVIGFCMGGGFALMMLGDFDAAASCYGQLPGALDAAVADACPVVGSFGGADRSLPGAAARLDDALTGAGVVHDVHEYPGAGHLFLNDRSVGPSALHPIFRVGGFKPDPAAASEAWPRIEAFLTEHLTAPASHTVVT